ncbi:MAG TPA: CAP domain-containing protein [Actinomycetota bacterium]|nr:CAP domain-containing protein [Actinomycetota bacterium]
MKRLINAARADAGLGPVKLSVKPIKPARKHSRSMKAEQQLWHSNLAVTLKNVSWSSAAENVGVASTVWKLHEAFMNSSAHRSNLLGKSWTKVSIGLATDANGMRWGTIVFYRN